MVPGEDMWKNSYYAPPTSFDSSLEIISSFNDERHLRNPTSASSAYSSQWWQLDQDITPAAMRESCHDTYGQADLTHTAMREDGQTCWDHESSSPWASLFIAPEKACDQGAADWLGSCESGANPDDSDEDDEEESSEGAQQQEYAGAPLAASPQVQATTQSHRDPPVYAHTHSTAKDLRSSSNNTYQFSYPAAYEEPPAHMAPPPSLPPPPPPSATQAMKAAPSTLSDPRAPSSKRTLHNPRVSVSSKGIVYKEDEEDESEEDDEEEEQEEEEDSDEEDARSTSSKRRSKSDALWEPRKRRSPSRYASTYVSHTASGSSKGSRAGGSVSRSKSRISSSGRERRVNRPKHNHSRQAKEILRAWFYSHLHIPGGPYPSEAVKDELAEQTGLTRIQISNFYINERKRRSDWKTAAEGMVNAPQRKMSATPPGQATGTKPVRSR